MPLTSVATLNPLLVVDPRTIPLFTPDEVHDHTLKAFQLYASADDEDDLVPVWLYRDQLQNQFDPEPPPVPIELSGEVTKVSLTKWAFLLAAQGLEYAPAGKCWHYKLHWRNWMFSIFDPPCDYTLTTFNVLDYGFINYMKEIGHEGEFRGSDGSVCTPYGDTTDSFVGLVFPPATLNLEITEYVDYNPTTGTCDFGSPGGFMPVPIFPLKAEINHDVPVPPLIPCECVDGEPGPPGPPGADGGVGMLEEFHLAHPEWDKENKEWVQVDTIVNLPSDPDSGRHMGTAFGVLYDALYKLLKLLPPPSDEVKPDNIGRIDYFDDTSTNV